LNNTIRHLRDERNWTLRHLERISGIPINALWRIEKGSLPMLDKAFRLARAFQLTIYDLWDIPVPATPAPPYISLLPDKLKIRAFRNARGWHLKDLARATAIPSSTLSEIERGANPNLKNAASIAITLGLSIHDLWVTSPVPRRRPIG
jgi:transcriptional regulator with XRE-family HTH domain